MNPEGAQRDEGSDLPGGAEAERPRQNRMAAQRLAEALGDNYLGSRQDRGELTLWVQPTSWPTAAARLREFGFSVLSDLTAIDYLDRKPRFDISLIALNMEAKEVLRMKTMVDEEVATLIPVWPGANWFEREIYDLFGVHFVGHPAERRLLLPADYHGHPLRKDYPVTGPASSVYR